MSRKLVILEKLIVAARRRSLSGGQISHLVVIERNHAGQETCKTLQALHALGMSACVTVAFTYGEGLFRVLARVERPSIEKRGG